MSKHGRDDSAEEHGLDINVDAVAFDDAFLDGLSRGEDITGGTDPLAGLLLGLVDEVNAPAPAVPNLDDILPVTHDPATTTFPAVTTITPVREEPADTTSSSSSTGAEDHAPADVVSLSERRDRRRTHRVGWLGAGLTGAAAATLVIAGGGAMIHSSEPGDALWGLNETIFGNHAAVVKLASTLEEADTRNANGDVQGALQLLEQAKALAQKMNTNQQAVQPTKTVTVTATPQAPVAADTAGTVTVTTTAEPVTVEPSATTVTHTVVVTPSPKPSATNLPPGVKPTTQAVPLTAVMPTAQATSATASMPSAEVTTKTVAPAPTTTEGSVTSE